MDNQTILNNLRQKLRHAYSPYSKVKVVAAIEFDIDGESHIAYGVNVENVSYGLTICAERSAISAAIIKGMKSIKSVYVMSNQSQAISPCGACRQVISEFIEDPNARVVCINNDESKKWDSSVGDLLPNRFTLD